MKIRALGVMAKGVVMHLQLTQCTVMHLGFGIRLRLGKGLGFGFGFFG